MAAAEVADLHIALAEEDGQHVREGHIGIRETRDRLWVLEQARKAAVLRFPVLRPALLDPAARIGVRDDVPRLVCRRAQHAHGVVMREHEVLDRLVSQLPQCLEPLARGSRRRPSVDTQDGLGPDDRADVRVALGREGVDAVGELLERRALLGGVGGRRERFGSHWVAGWATGTPSRYSSRTEASGSTPGTSLATTTIVSRTRTLPTVTGSGEAAPGARRRTVDSSTTPSAASARSQSEAPQRGQRRRAGKTSCPQRVQRNMGNPVTRPSGALRRSSTLRSG